MRVCTRASVCFVLWRGRQHAYLMAQWDAVIQSGPVAQRVGGERGGRTEHDQRKGGEPLVQPDPPPPIRPFGSLWGHTA